MGVILWVPDSSDYAHDIAVDDSGNVYVTGYSVGEGTFSDYATVKYNSDGVEQWVARYNSPANSVDKAFTLAIDNSGNVYVTGYSYSPDTFTDYTTIKYNSEGIEQWVTIYNGNGNSYDDARDIAVDQSGNVYITGESLGSGGGKEYATVKYNSNGVEQWVAIYTGPGLGSYATSIAVSASGNVYVTGLSGGVGTDSDYATVKYNSDGVEQWVARYNGPHNMYDGALSIVIDDSENVYVTGYSHIDYYHQIYATIKYIQGPPVSVEENNINKPTSFQLSQNYPNPFNARTVITYELKNSAFVSLTVFNVMGKEVIALMNENQKPGNYEVVWDGRNSYRKEVSTGIYLYGLKTDTFSQIKKMILIH